MTRDEILQALASASSLSEQIKLVGELDALEHGARRTASADRSADWSDTTVKRTLAPCRTLDRHTAASDWLAEAEMTPAGSHHQAVIAEASIWFRHLDADVRADAQEFTEQAKGIARRTAGKYGEAADEAADAFLQYVAFLNREVLAASGLPQVQQRVDAFENESPTPLPTQVFDNFAAPVHPINQGVDGAQTDSLAPGAQEAVSGGGTPAGRPSEHEEGQDPVSEPYYPPASAKQGSHRHAGMLERVKDVTARKGHAMEWTSGQGQDGWVGRCTGCQASVAVNATGVMGGNAHTSACNNRAHALLGGGPSVAIGYTMNMDDFLRAEASQPNSDLSGWAGDEPVNDRTSPETAGQMEGEDPDYIDWTQGVNRKAGGAAPFAREAREHRDGKKEAASGLDQVQQTMDAFENPRATSLPQDTMFPITQEWPETSTAEVTDQGGQDTGPTNRPRQANRKQADTWSGGDGPKAVPGGETPVANSPETTPERASSGNFEQGAAKGRSDAASGQAPDFADNSSKASDFVRGYVQGYGTGPQRSGPQDVPVGMGGDNGQAQNAAEIAQRTEKPLVMAKMTVSASLVSKNVADDADFQRGYRYGRTWKDGVQLVATGSRGEEAGIYAGITDNPGVQRAWVAAHRKEGAEHPELAQRLRSHRLVTSSLRRRDEALTVRGLYVQAGTSLDLDTMSPLSSPDPQGATPSEGPGTIPPLRDAPGTPAAPGGASPYNGTEPYGQPVVPDPMIQDLEAEPERPRSPDAVHIQGDSSLMGKSPQAMAFRRRVQANKLALRHKKEN